MDWQVEYYQKESGTVPVRDFLLSLSPKMRAKAFHEIELLKQHGFDLREPYIKALHGKKYRGLYELRIRIGTDSSRIFYICCHENTFVLLHGFIKKTDDIPVGELNRAMRCKNDFEKRAKNGEGQRFI